jgi:CDP-alcohol phosphatidyltransferase
MPTAPTTTTTTPTTSYLYDRVLSPFYDDLAERLWPAWVHPNWITLLGGCCAHKAQRAMLLLQQQSETNAGAAATAAFVWFTLYHMCDNMDGKHARRTHRASALGALLDHLVDGTVGSCAGYTAVARILFGLRPGSSGEGGDGDWWKGMHAYSCLWLSPHVVCLYTGRLHLGTRLFSIDEAFLLVSILLAIQAVLVAVTGGGGGPDGVDLLMLPKSWIPVLIQIVHTLAAVNVIGSLLYHGAVTTAATKKQGNERGRRRTWWRWWWNIALVLCAAVFWACPNPTISAWHPHRSVWWSWHMCWIPTMTAILVANSSSKSP